MKQNFFNYLIVTSLVLALGFSGFWGWQTARAKQASLAVLKNTTALKQGLEYFLNDYERYPKDSEFASELLMQDYFSAFPPKNFISKDCPKSFNYNRIDITSFSLSFCLISPVAGYRSGWNN